MFPCFGRAGSTLILGLLGFIPVAFSTRRFSVRGGAARCLEGCLSASLTSTQQMPMEPPWLWPLRIFVDIAKCPQDIKLGGEITLGWESLPSRFHGYEPFGENELLLILSCCHHLPLYIPILRCQSLLLSTYNVPGMVQSWGRVVCKHTCSLTYIKICVCSHILFLIGNLNAVLNIFFSL